MHTSTNYKFPETFSQVADTARELLLNLRSSFDPTKVKQLHELFKKLPCPPINYNEYSNVFTYTYFLMNYWKGASVFIDEGNHIPRKILDIGAGSGAVSVAYLACIEHLLKKTDGNWQLELFLLDVNRSQISHAQKILQTVRSSLRRTSFNLHIEIEPIDYLLKLKGHFDVILMGHILNENQHLITSLLKKAATLLTPGGSLFIIERINEPVWELINEGIQNLTLASRWGNRTFSTNGLSIIQPEGFPQITTLSTRYLVLQKPKNSVFEFLVHSYFEAWRKQSVDLLEKIFAENAEYHEKFSRRPIKGLKAIIEYWHKKVLPQVNPNPKILRVDYIGDDALIEWSTIFRLEKKQVCLRGFMILTIDSHEKKIQKIEEIYSKTLKHIGSREWTTIR